jgi:hypothetical protein
MRERVDRSKTGLAAAPAASIFTTRHCSVAADYSRQSPAMIFGHRSCGCVLRDREPPGVQAHASKSHFRARAERRHGSWDTLACTSCFGFDRPNCADPKHGGTVCGDHDVGTGYAAFGSNSGGRAHYRITAVIAPEVIYDRGEAAEKRPIAAATQTSWPRGLHPRG